MMAEIINVARDFHPLPAGRYPVDGEGNGATFREKFLLPAIKKGTKITVDLRGAPGFPSSFLEEAFGGLVRAGVSVQMIRDCLEFETAPGQERYVRRIWEHINRANQAATHH